MPPTCLNLSRQPLSGKTLALLIAFCILLGASGNARGYVLTGGTPPANAPAPGEQYTVMQAGLFEYSKVDLTLAAPLPIEVVRTYRSFDKDAANHIVYGAFGVGTTLNYDLYLYSADEVSSGTYRNASVVLPDGAQIKCPNTNSSNDYTVANFVCNTQPVGVWFGSTITYNSSRPGWDLHRKDGAVYAFGLGSPLVSITDRNNNQITLTRTNGQVTQITASNGRSVTISYGSNGYISSVQDNTSQYPSQTPRVVQYSYSANKQLTSVLYPNIDSHAKTIYGWNSTYLTDINTIQTNLAFINNTLSYDILYIAYDNTVHRVTNVYPGNNTAWGITYAYANCASTTVNCKVTATFPDGTTREMFFSPNPNGYLVQDYRGSMSNNILTQINRNSTNNLVSSIVDPLSRETDYTYDSNANVLTVTQQASNSSSCTSPVTEWRFAYGTNSQVTSVTNPLNETTSYGLDPLGNVRSETDPLGNIWSYGVNSAGQLTSVTDPGAATPLYDLGYSSQGDLGSVADRLGDTTTYAYDAFGRLTSTTSPANEKAMVNQYDDQDEILSVTDPAGKTTTYSYLFNGLISSLTDGSGSVNPPPLTTTFDWTPPLTANNWNLKITDPLGKTQLYLVETQGMLVDQYTDQRGVQDNFTYDNLGRRTKAVYDANNVLGAGSRTITYQYDNGDRVTQIADSGGGEPGNVGNTQFFQYDALDNVCQAISEYGPNNIHSEGQINYSYNWIERSSMSVFSPYANFTVNYQYNKDDQVTSVSAPFASASLGYYPSGLRSSLTVNNGSASTTTSYGLDAALRLSSLSYASNSIPLGGLNYTLDADGRIIGKTGSFATISLPATAAATYDNGNQIATWDGVQTQRDNAHALLADPSTGNAETYTWGERNGFLLKSVNNSPAGNTTYFYDGTGRRESASQVAGGTTTNTTFVHDFSVPIEFYTSSGSNINLLTMPGSDEILVDASGTPLHDNIGTTIGYINSAGTMTARYSYDPFGSANISSGPAWSPSLPTQYGQFHGLGGMELDPTGLYHTPGRYYNSALARFPVEDPAGFQGGQLNLFTYAGNDPVNRSDPSGLDPEIPSGGGGEGGGGGGIPGWLGGLIQFWTDVFTGPNNSPRTFNRLQATHRLGMSLQKSGVQQGTIIISQVALTKGAGSVTSSGQTALSPQLGNGITPQPSSACSQYDSECRASGQSDEYACRAGDCCRFFGESSFGQCTRGCLLQYESKSCFGSPSVASCRSDAHLQCYKNCAQSPGDMVQWLRSPACRELSPYLLP